MNNPGSLQNKHRHDCSCVLVSKLERVLLYGASPDCASLRFLFALNFGACLSFEGASSA